MMTNKEAKSILQSLKFIVDDYSDSIEEAIDMAIDALSAGRYENAMQKLREMPRHLNGIKANQIKKIPSETVQVVRCKDCKHYLNEHICMYFSKYGTIETSSDAYCSCGERREP